MKKLKNLLWVILLPILVFSSCNSSNDKESTSIKSSLIGVWKTSMYKPMGNISYAWSTIRISPNGRLKCYYKTKSELEKYTYDSTQNMYYLYDYPEAGTTPSTTYIVSQYDPTDDAYWAFDEVNQTVSMYREGNSDAYTFKVIMSDDKNSWAGVDSEGKTYSFVRIEE